MTCAPAYGLGTSKKKKKKKKNPTQIMTCAPAYGLGTSKKKKKKKKNPTQIMTCAPAYGLGTSNNRSSESALDKASVHQHCKGDFLSHSSIHYLRKQIPCTTRATENLINKHGCRREDFYLSLLAHLSFSFV